MKFISKKYKELRLVLKPISKQIVGISSQIIPGVTVEFHNFEYSTENQEMIAALKAHTGFGVQFFSDEAEANVPNIEGLRLENEKKTIAEEVGSLCPECGFQAKNSAGLRFHMKVHEK